MMKKSLLKRALVLALVLLTVACAALPALAIQANEYHPITEYEAITIGNVWLRKTADPAVGSNKIMEIPKGSKVTVLGDNGTTWFYIRFGSYTGFAYQADISSASGSVVTDPAPTPTPTPSTDGSAVYTQIASFTGTTKEKVYLRKTANKSTESSNVVAKISSGKSVTVLGESGDWYYITYGSYSGFARKVDIAAANATDTSGISGGGTDTSAVYTPVTNFAATTKERVWLRKTANKSTDSANVVTKISTGKSVTVLGESGDWYYISYSSYNGFARKIDILAVGADPAVSGVSNNYTAVTEAAAVTTEKVFLRKTADKSTADTNVVTKISGGSAVTIVGESGDWYFIKYGAYEGYARKVDISTGSTAAGGGAGNPSGDTWGHISIAGTNIDKDIMSNRISGGKYVYNAYSSGKSYIYSLSNYGANPAVIMGHNMRTSRTGFHALHHVQNGLSNGKKCEKCGASPVGTSTFSINFNGSSSWQVVGFYETPKGTSSYVKNYSACAYATTVDAWLSYQMSNISKYGGTLVSSASANDKLMILITCGDTTSNSKGAGLYFILKAVN